MSEHHILHEAGDLLRWAVALTVYPFLLIDDLIHQREEERWIEEHKQRMRDMHEGQ